MAKTNDSEDFTAYRKVRLYSPKSNEKTTLLAIALRAQSDGFGCFVGFKQLSKDTGNGIRTLKRHVQILIDRGELVTFCDLHDRTKGRQFFIPIAAETIEEIEARTGVSRKQIKLPLVQRDRSVFTQYDQVPTRHLPSANSALPECQGGTLTISQQDFKNVTGSFQLKTKRDRMIEKQVKEEDEDLQKMEISPDVQELIAATMAKLTSPVKEPKQGVVREGGYRRSTL